jgi:hypothetical protein
MVEQMRLDTLEILHISSTARLPIIAASYQMAAALLLSQQRTAH